MENPFPRRICLVVVHLDDRRLVIGAHRIVIQEFGADDILPLQFSLQLRIPLLQHILVHKLRLEEIPALLDVLHPRLPVQVQQIHPKYADIPHAAKLVLVPNDLVASCSRLALLPHGIVVHGLKIVLLQHTGDDGTKHLCLRLVPLLPGQNVRLRVCLHGICVLGGNHIVKPCAPGVEALLRRHGGLLPGLLGVSQLPPVFGRYDPIPGSAGSALVAVQDPCELHQLLMPHRLRSLLLHPGLRNHSLNFLVCKIHKNLLKKAVIANQAADLCGNPPVI